jgi:O-antigen/teichoic acid export membrane protein
LTLLLTASLLVGMYTTSFMQGMHRFLAFNLTKTIPIPIYGFALVVLTVAGIGGLTSFAVSLTTIMIGTAIVSVLVVRRWLPPSGGEDVPRRSLLAYGLKGQIGGASPLETFQIDFLIVGALIGPYALGLYAGAMAFTNLPRFVAQSVGVVAFPRVAASVGTDHAIRSALDAVGLASAFAIVVVAGLEVIIGWLIPFLFGDAFAASVPIARVLLLSALFLSVRRIIGDVMRGGGAPLPSTSAEVISWVVYAALIVPLVNSHGALGAAWAMTAAAAVSTAWLTYLAVQMLKRLQIDSAVRAAADADGHDA